MWNENQQDPINLHITIPSIVVNKHDNREIGMHIENADHVTHNYTFEEPSLSQATSSPQHDSSNPQEHVTNTVEQPSVSQATSSLQYDSSNPQEHVTNTVEQPSVSQATSSLQDMQINPKDGGVTLQKPTIEDIFEPTDVGRPLRKRKYHEAYVICCRRMKFDPAVIGYKVLVNHYRCCMLVGKAEEAIRTKNKLTFFLKEKSQTTPNEIETFADTIRGEERDMEPILFYQIAAEFYGNQSKAGLVGIENCVNGIRLSIKPMLSRDKGLKPIVRTHVIPLMRDMREMIRRSDDVSEEVRCLQEVNCLYSIELSEGLVGNLDGKETAGKEAIAIMERVFKERAGKHSVYGTCLNNLGSTYVKTSRPNDANQYFRKAIAAFGEAEDINDDLRDKKIAISIQGLKNAKRQMK